jgi:sterol desaturase/sphingolipid hydroxylase (fatty acid hydroxylase superfamily)
VEAIIAWLREVPLGLAALVFLAKNVLVLLLTVAVGEALRRRFAHRRVAPEPPPIERRELGLAAACAVLNSVVTFAGLLLWREGFIRFRLDFGPRVLVDLVVLVLVMDAAMYALHRVAHARLLYARLHAPHHLYEHARPLTLFVLSPVEVLGFGALWLAVCVLYEASWLGMLLYLVFNTLWGVLGHIGVEPFPDGWVRWPVVGRIATTTFHARHHLDLGHNFGFYTVLWDRLFGTLAPDYEATFARPQEPAAAPPELAVTPPASG